MTYPEVYMGLIKETAIVAFLKKDGTYRVMLATRNMKTAAIYYSREQCNLGWHESKCGIENGNIAVIDLIIGEPRMFNIDRVLQIKFIGEIDSKEKFDETVEYFKQYKEKFEETMGDSMNVDF